MKIKTSRDGAKWIEVTRALLLWKEPKGRGTKFVFWKAPGLKKFYGLVNCRFSIWLYAKHEGFSFKNLRWFIRLPFFYWEKDNSGWIFGSNSIHLWWHEARAK